MPRLARVVIPGLPHHITQRGNRRQRTFFHDGDYRLYLRLLAEWCEHHEVAIWAWCLMPNHVHLVAVPSRPEALAAAFGEAHRRYSRHINQRHDWRGFLWQGRFSSCPMDERHLLMAVRYVELNPVRAGLVARPELWPWSSVHAHLRGSGDGLCTLAPMRDRIADWPTFLGAGLSDDDLEALRVHARTGRPLGDDAFVERLEAETGRLLRPARGGRPRRSRD